MVNFLRKIFWYFWERNYFIAKKFKLGSSTEEFSIISIFLSSLIFSIANACVLFFFQVERKYSIDIKILSLIFFVSISISQLLYLFNSQKRYLQLNQSDSSTFSILIYFIICLLIFILLGMSMIYDYFQGDFDLFLRYIKDNY